MPRRSGASFETVGIVLLAGGLSASCPRMAQSTPLTLVGTWEGKVAVRTAEQSLSVTFASDSEPVAGTVSVPDDYALDFPLRSVKREGTSVHFEYPQELKAGVFDGTLERGRIYGRFTGEQYGDALEGTFELWRRPPARAAFATEEVRFRGGEGMLAGTLFLPSGAEPHPAVVFFHGSGPQTRDSYLRHFAARFARAGMAALIYDKRGTGASEGTEWMKSSAKFSDLARDGLAGVALLRQRSEIDAARIGVWGLSQGAWLGPLAAAQSADVAFVVMLSGGGVSPSEQELYDDEVKLRALGYSEADVAEALALLRLGDDFVRDGRDETWTRVQESLAAARQRPWFRYLDKFPLVLPREAWWHGNELDYDPRPTLRQVRVPTLVILGASDLSTPTAETARRIESAFGGGATKNLTITVLPGADHALQLGPDPWLRLKLAGAGGVPASTEPAPPWDWMRPAPGWEDTMIQWVLEH